MFHNLKDAEQVRQVQHDGGTVDQVPGHGVGHAEQPPQEAASCCVYVP